MFTFNESIKLNSYSLTQTAPHTSCNQWTAIIAPPIAMTSDYVQQQGISASNALVIHKAKINNKFLTILKAAQSPTIASIVTWDSGLTEAEVFQIQSTMKALNKKCLIHSAKNLH